MADAAYRAVNTIRTVALDKCLAVRLLGLVRSGCASGLTVVTRRPRPQQPTPAGIPSSVWACDRGSRPTSMLFRPFGHSWRDGPRTAPRRRRMTVTHPATQPCGVASVPRVCSPPGSIPGLLRMPCSPGTNRRLASALLSSTPTMASTRSTDISCCGMQPTADGIGEADSCSTGTGTGSGAWSGRNRVNPLSRDQPISHAVERGPLLMELGKQIRVQPVPALGPVLGLVGTG